MGGQVGALVCKETWRDLLPKIYIEFITYKLRGVSVSNIKVVVASKCSTTYHVQVERVGLAQAGTLEADTSSKSQPFCLGIERLLSFVNLQEDRETDDGVTTQNLGGPNDHVLEEESLRHSSDASLCVSITYDLGSTTVDSLETLDIRRSGSLSVFEGDSVDERCQGSSNSVFGLLFVPLTSQSSETDTGLFDASLSDQEPRGFRHPEEADEKRDRPDPLQAKGQTPGQVAGEFQCASSHSRGDEDAPSPALTDKRRQDGSKDSGYDLNCIGGREGLEATPGKSTEEFARSKHGQVDGKEGDKDGAGHGDESDQHSLLAPVSVHAVTTDG